MCMNVYDTRLLDDWPACGMNWPPDLTDIYTFLRVGTASKGRFAESGAGADIAESRGH
jgi:hypothetical protein